MPGYVVAGAVVLIARVEAIAAKRHPPAHAQQRPSHNSPHTAETRLDDQNDMLPAKKIEKLAKSSDKWRQNGTF